MKKIITYILLLLIIVSCTKDELNVLPPAVDWEMNIIGTIYDNNINDVVSLNFINNNIYTLEGTPDNGFVLAINGDIRKYSSEGDSLWQKSFSESVKAVQNLSNNEYLLYGLDSTNIWIAKTDQNWDVIWETLVAFEFEGSDPVLKGIVEANDGVVIGTQQTSLTPRSELIKLDNNGNLLWKNKFENLDGTKLYGIETTDDGNTFVVGSIQLGSSGTDIAWFAQLDNNGNIVNGKIVSDYSYFNSLQQRIEGDFITLIDHDFVGIINKDGEIQSKNPLGNSSFSVIDEMQSGEWIMLGQHRVGQFMGGTSASTSFAKLDNDGQRTWQIQLGSFGYDDSQLGMAACQLTDGSYVFLILYDYYYGEEQTYILTKTEIN